MLHHSFTSKLLIIGLTDCCMPSAFSGRAITKSASLEFHEGQVYWSLADKTLLKQTPPAVRLENGKSLPLKITLQDEYEAFSDLAPYLNQALPWQEKSPISKPLGFE